MSVSSLALWAGTLTYIEQPENFISLLLNFKNYLESQHLVANYLFVIHGMAVLVNYPIFIMLKKKEKLHYLIKYGK